MIADVDDIAHRLCHGYTPATGRIVLAMGEFSIAIRSNSDSLLARLADYFRHVVEDDCETERELLAIDSPANDLGLEYADWAREPGKSGRKDSYLDLPGARLVRKVRTGMLFLQSRNRLIAAGPCLQHENQVINFINSQYMNHLQRNGGLICHAAAVVRDGRAFGIAGLSGGGKSTLMLKLLEDERVFYLTNDRLFIRQEAGCMAAGIPKQPRINPGTALHNPRLAPVIPVERMESLSALTKAELWDVEEKYDIDISRTYGPGRIVERAPLQGFLILNWSREGNQEWQIAPLDLNGRRDLLPAVMKSPGPFYQRADGTFLTDDEPLDEEAYLAMLSGVPFFEVTGTIDFDAVADYCRERLLIGGGDPR